MQTTKRGNKFDISAAMQMMSHATHMPHVFEDVGECVELGCGDILYALRLRDQLYLACLNGDTQRVCVTPVERWEPDNLRDCLDGTPLISLDQCISDVIAREAERAIAAASMPSRTSH